MPLALRAATWICNKVFAACSPPMTAIRAAFHAEKVGALVRLAKDVGRVGEKAGMRAAQDTLKIAENPKDVARAARGAGTAVEGILPGFLRDVEPPLTQGETTENPMPYAANLEHETLPKPHRIVAAVKKACYR